MGKMFLVFVVLLVGGCSKAPDVMLDKEWAADKPSQAKLFARCMELLPAGPASTKYNDWDDVVDSCHNSARWLAMYCYGLDCEPGSSLSQLRESIVAAPPTTEQQE